MATNTSWLPLPPPSRLGGWQRVLAALLLAAALAGVTSTVVMWRAEANERAGNYVRAAWWRPGVALYHRQWSETLLLTSPPQSEQQALIALRLNPYNPVTIADVTTVELALGRWSGAVGFNAHNQAREPSFGDYWRLANLFLAHNDPEGFWRELPVADRLARPDYFDSIVSRALTASNQDFRRLRIALPSTSVAAASAYLAAAVAARNREAALAGADWLLSLPAPTDTLQNDQRRGAALDLLELAWQTWPDAAPGLWRRIQAAGIAVGSAKLPSPPYLADGNFDPGVAARLLPLAPAPWDPLRALLDWRWPRDINLVREPVLTGDAAHPSAVELLFDGNQHDDVDLAQQSFLATPGTTLTLGAWSRRLAPGSDQGISLRITDQKNLVLAELPLPAEAAWRFWQTTLTLPRAADAAPLASYQVALHFRRPLGNTLLQQPVLVTGVTLQ